jgi:surface protein
MKFKFEQKDVNQPVKILYNMKNVIEGCNIRELNEKNTELYINNKRTKYKSYFIPEKEGEYKIELRFNINLTDCSYMFSGCENIKYINFSNFSTSNVKNMRCMFYGCKSLNSLPDISKWDTSNVEDMSYMFSGCNSLNSLPDISKWDTSNVKNMRSMFGECLSTINIPPKFDK